MGNKCYKIPMDETIIEFEEIESTQDAVEWMQKHFPNEKQRILSTLQRDDHILCRKSYSRSKKSNEIIIYFGMRHCITAF